MLKRGKSAAFLPVRGRPEAISRSLTLKRLFTFLSRLQRGFNALFRTAGINCKYSPPENRASTPEEMKCDRWCYLLCSRTGKQRLVTATSNPRNFSFSFATSYLKNDHTLHLRHCTFHSLELFYTNHFKSPDLFSERPQIFTTRRGSAFLPRAKVYNWPPRSLPPRMRTNFGRRGLSTEDGRTINGFVSLLW